MNHVMPTAPPDLRSTQISETRRRIALAVAEVLADGGAAELSFPAVAERANVSLRTVYRHFPNKDALAAGALQAGSERTLAVHPLDELGLDDVRPFLRDLWSELIELRDLVTAGQMTPHGREVRGERLRQRREIVRAAVERDDPELDATSAERLANLVTPLMSGALLLDFVEGLGVDVDEAALLAAYAIEAALERVRREGGLR
jgi:AcrR family transcriptional regulator